MNKLTNAPVALFAYSRPHHLALVLQSLGKCPESDQTELYIFIDGPRGQEDLSRVEEVRRLAFTVSGFKAINIEVSEHNRGLATSITRGVSQILEDYEKVIVLEDDIVVSPHFLAYMNEHLDLYAEEEKVASIHAYVYPHERVTLPDTFFIRGADCWGWGTWKRAWKTYEDDGALLLNELRRRDLISVFDFEGSAPYEEMLIDQIASRNDSWAVRWYASALLHDMLTLYPAIPMAINIGEDHSGTHGGSSDTYQQTLSTDPVACRPIPLIESPDGRKAFQEFFRTRYRIPSSSVGRWAWCRARRLKVTFARNFPR